MSLPQQRHKLIHLEPGNTARQSLNKVCLHEGSLDISRAIGG